ncbi:MAG: CbtA family protein [Alphaproteobacteria bacterium]|nr:CbtA family protein [Alphaproteobacteria bacterium]
MYFRLGIVALLAGIIGGSVLSAVQLPFVTPLILEAERYEETGTQNHAHEEGEASAPSQRTFLTLAANFLTAIAFALLLNAGLGLAGESGWRAGLLWGLGGFTAFSLAPSVGLPPELPGTPAGDLFERQVWWFGTAAATGAALFLFGRFRKPLWVLLGVVLVALPHAIGAPDARGPGTAPDSLARTFVAMTLFANLLFWVTLGVASGVLQARFVRGGKC